MSTTKIHICVLILKQHFGEVVAKVGEYLMQKGAMPLPYIMRDTGIKMAKVKMVLATMIEHNICYYIKSVRGMMEYMVDTEAILLFNRLPQFIYSAKTLYGDAAELVVEEVLNVGHAHMSVICQRVAKRLDEAAEADGTGGTTKMTIFQIRDKFIELVQTHFLQRVPSLNPDPATKEDGENLYEVPEIDFSNNGKRKRSGDSGEQNPSKKQKLDRDNTSSPTAYPEDEDIVWRVNVDRFHQYLRDQAIISAVARKIDKRTGEVIRTVLRLSETRTQDKAPYTNPVSYHEIMAALPAELNINKQMLDQTLKIATEDSTGFVLRVGDSSGGTYSIDFQKALTCLATAHIESVILERFGSKALRIFRVLLIKKKLEQKTIEEMVMTPAKEVKVLLYKMYAENFVHANEICKTPEHAPSRTFYLFHVNIRKVAMKLQEHSYTTLYNLMRRRECETKKHKRLLLKKERVEAIIISLESEGGDAAQIADVKDSISSAENATIAKVKRMTDYLDMSETQVDSALMIYNMYLDYVIMKS